VDYGYGTARLLKAVTQGRKVTRRQLSLGDEDDEDAVAGRRNAPETGCCLLSGIRKTK
jgi:hypothetical protein